MGNEKDTPENKAVREVKLLRKLDFWYEAYNKKLFPLTKEQKSMLIEHGYLEEKKDPAAKKSEKEVADIPTEFKSKVQKQYSAITEVLEEDQELIDPSDFEITDELVYAEVKDDIRYIYDGSKDISKEDWKPESLIHHTPEFVEFIDSINSGFQKLSHYKPFQLYCQQSNDWMSESNESIYDYEIKEDQRDYAFREIERISENSLYFLDKYVHVKESTDDKGYMDYLAKPVHKVMAFLFDCGYSVEMGKPRQIAATTTMGGLAACKLLTTKNFFIKMIAQDKDKVQEIFDDKIKYVFSELPGWLYHEVKSDSATTMEFSTKEKKGKKGGVNSKIEVVAPTVSAINGGAPPLVLIDEGGYIGILGKMIKEARPTMFVQDQKTRKLTMKRQIWIWGTGGEMDKKGKAYEIELKTTFKKWKERDFEYGIIPIFFDWTTRPGMSRKFYLQEKRNYTVEGPKSEERMVQFHQTYPSVLEDMFLTSSKTLVPSLYINRRLEKIRKLSEDQREQWGYFEPIYGNKQSADHDDLPFNLIGATFVPTPKGDPRASTKIFMHPKRNWLNRYYKGTDPIMNDNGYSNMASSIWDAHFNTLAAVTNYRDPSTNYTFLQHLLLGIYYDVESNHKVGTKDLLESNIGKAYQQYCEYKGFGRALVLKSELPSSFQGGGQEVGVDNRGARTRFIINNISELIELYGNNIYIEDFWIQLGTFVCTISDAGNETWGVQDKREFHDDVLFSTVFSYICAKSFEFRPPINKLKKQDRERVKYELQRDGDGNLIRVPVKIKVAS